MKQREKKKEDNVKWGISDVYNQNFWIRLNEIRREFPNSAASPDTTPVLDRITEKGVRLDPEKRDSSVTACLRSNIPFQEFPTRKTSGVFRSR